MRDPATDLGRLFAYGASLALCASLIASPALGDEASGEDVDVPAPPALVQEEAEEETSLSRRTQIEEVVVTGQRRETNLQTTPIAISAFSADDIARSDLDSFEKLQFQVPGMTFARGTFYTYITVRGVGLEVPTLGEPGVALNIDGVYQARSYLSSGIYDDLERIEVLRGPQGTLYGRNATGGAMNLWTKTPPESTEAEFSALAGDNNRYRIRSALGGPINEQLGLRLSYTTDQSDGLRRNNFNGDKLDDTDHHSLRGALRYTPTEDLEILVRYDWARDRGNGPTFQHAGQLIPFGPVTFGGTLEPDAQRVNVDRKLDNEKRIWGISSTIKLDLHGLPLIGDATLNSITSFRYNRMELDGDLDGTEANFINTNQEDTSKVWTQELTLSSAGDGKLDWVVGAYFFKDRADTSFFYTLPDLAALAQPILDGGGTGFDVLDAGIVDNFIFAMDQDTEAWALFGEATYHVTERLRATVGIRYSDEEKDFDQLVSFGVPGLEDVPGFGHDFFLCEGLESDLDFTSWTPKFGVDFDVSESVMAYASASRGFKGGGMNADVCGSDFDQESLWSYEIGVKSRWLDDRLQLNLVGFFYDYEDYQAIVNIANSSTIENAADAEVLGFEAELRAFPFEGFQLTAGLSIQNAEFEDYDSLDPFFGEFRDLKGNQLPRAPDKTFFINGDYTVPISDLGSASLRYEYAWSDNYYFTSFNETFSEQSSYSVSNARLILATAGGRLEDTLGDFELHFFVNNLGDKDYLYQVADVATVGGQMRLYADPRRYGVELKYRFH